MSRDDRTWCVPRGIGAVLWTTYRVPTLLRGGCLALRIVREEERPGAHGRDGCNDGGSGES